MPAIGADISLRDYFAAKAMAGLLAEASRTFPTTLTEEDLAAQVACAAYIMADAMLAERDKTLWELIPDSKDER